jgi:hypothetical protein
MNGDQQLDHGPVLAALGFLGVHQIRHAEQVEYDAVWIGEDRPPFPQHPKVGQVAQTGHDVHAQFLDAGSRAPEMDRVAAPQQSGIEGRHANAPGGQHVERPSEPGEVARVGEQDDVHVLANLRRALEDAGLPAHEQRLDAIGLESRKDLSDRGRDQGCLPSPGIARTVVRCDGTAQAE